MVLLKYSACDDPTLADCPCVSKVIPSCGTTDDDVVSLELAEGVLATSGDPAYTCSSPSTSNKACWSGTGDMMLLEAIELEPDASGDATWAICSRSSTPCCEVEGEELSSAACSTLLVESLPLRVRDDFEASLVAFRFLLRLDLPARVVASSVEANDSTG